MPYPWSGEYEIFPETEILPVKCRGCFGILELLVPWQEDMVLAGAASKVFHNTDFPERNLEVYLAEGIDIVPPNIVDCCNTLEGTNFDSESLEDRKRAFAQLYSDKDGEHYQALLSDISDYELDMKISTSICRGKGPMAFPVNRENGNTTELCRTDLARANFRDCDEIVLTIRHPLNDQ